MSEVIKISPDEDLYVAWSHICDAPLMWGNREEVTQYLLERGEYNLENTPSARLDRAADTGSSTIGDGGCTWDSSGLIYEQQGWLPRAKLRDLLLRLEADQHGDVTDMLLPIGDDDA